MKDHVQLTPDVVDRVARMFKVLSDPSRIRILHLLSQEECSVNHIADVLGLSQSAVSHQLGYLRNVNLVRYRREGTTILYACKDEHVISLLHQTISHAEHA